MKERGEREREREGGGGGRGRGFVLTELNVNISFMRFDLLYLHLSHIPVCTWQTLNFYMCRP